MPEVTRTRNNPTGSLAIAAEDIRKLLRNADTRRSNPQTVAAMLQMSDVDLYNAHMSNQGGSSRIGPNWLPGGGLTASQVIGIMAGGVAAAGGAAAGGSTALTEPAVGAGYEAAGTQASGVVTSAAPGASTVTAVPLAPVSGGAAGAAVPSGGAGAPVVDAAPPVAGTGPQVGPVKGLSDAVLASISGMSLSDAASIAGLGSSIAAMSASKPNMPSAPASPEAPPASQAGTVPTPAQLKRKKVGDPTALTGPGGIPFENLTLGRATVLGG